MSFASTFKKMVDEAPVAQGRVNVNFGPTTFIPMVVTFHGKGNPATKETLFEYATRKGVKPDEVEIDTKNESLQLHITIDVSDLNPALDFAYERDVQIVNSSKPKTGKPILTDWSETVLPSIEKVFGKNWYDKIIPQNGKKPPVFWTAAEQAESFRLGKDKDGNDKNFGVPKFIAVYEDRDECVAARDERYGTQEGSGSGMEVGGGEEGEESFSEETLESVWNLYKSNKFNRKRTMNLLGQDPFELGEVDNDALLDAAIAANEEEE